MEESKDKPTEMHGRKDNPEVCNHNVPVDFQSRPIYECIVVRSYEEEQIRAPDEVLNEEGELDGEYVVDPSDHQDANPRSGTDSLENEPINVMCNHTDESLPPMWAHLL